MRVIACRAALRRGLVCAMVVGLCLSSVLPAVEAQDAAPSGGPAIIRTMGQTVLLRERPGYDAAVLAALSDGSALDVTGAPATAGDGSSWLPVAVGGQSGFVPAGYVTGASSGTAPASTTTPAQGAATTTEANLRSGPTMDAAVLAVLPTGAAVSVDGAASNGFVPVTSNGVSGWVAAQLLTDGAAAGSAPGGPPTPAPAAADAAASAPPPTADPTPAAADPARGESTSIVWPVAGGAWEVVQGYNNGTHTNRSDFAQYKYSLDVARSDGDTAGRPVFAPVSGTVQWVDRGSGGILIDAGNGYGVALFHLTIDGAATGGSVERGQRIGTISGPGGDGYMSMAHFQITVWRLDGRSHTAEPFVGPNAIAGQEFPDTGGVNQYMGMTITP